MIRQDLILSKTRRLLDEFLAPLQSHVDKPRRRFLRQAVRGILLSGSLVVMEPDMRLTDEGNGNRGHRFFVARLASST